MILDMALGLLVSLAIVTGIIGAIAGLLAITIDWLLVRRETARTSRKIG